MAAFTKQSVTTNNTRQVSEINLQYLTEEDLKKMRCSAYKYIA